MSLMVDLRDSLAPDQVTSVREKLGLDTTRFLVHRGWIVSTDYSQLENRIITLLSGDSKMLELYASGRDVHTQTACDLFGLDYNELAYRLEHGLYEHERAEYRDDTALMRAISIAKGRAKAQRKIAKVVRYGMHYRGSAKTIHSQIVVAFPDIPLSKVEFMCEVFHQTYTGIMEYHNANARKATRDDFIESPISGRRLHFNGRVDLNLLANWPIQTAGADIIDSALISWSDDRQAHLRKHPSSWRRYERVLAQVHDSIVVSTPNPLGSAQLLAQHMSAEILVGEVKMGFPVDTELGCHSGSQVNGLLPVDLDPETMWHKALELALSASTVEPIGP